MLLSCLNEDGKGNHMSLFVMVVYRMFLSFIYINHLFVIIIIEFFARILIYSTSFQF